MPAPGLYQMSPLQFAQGGSPLAQQMQNLGKSLGSAGKTIQGMNATSAPPGADTTGMPGSPYAGPVDPNAGTQAGPAGVGLPGNAAAGPVAPNMSALSQGPGATAVTNLAQQLSPVQLLNWLKSTIGQGPTSNPLMLPGSAALGGAGMLAPTMNNPSALGGG